MLIEICLSVYNVNKYLLYSLITNEAPRCLLVVLVDHVGRYMVTS